MTTVTHKTNRVAEAQGNLIEQFRGRANVEAVVKAFAQQSQEVEDASFEILTETTIENAVGVQLDGLGQIVGIERGGSDDDEYRVRTQAQVLVNESSGTIDQLLEIMETLGATSFALSENFPAKIEIEIEDAFDGGATAAPLVNQARDGGIGLDVTWFTSTNPFTLDVAGKGLDQGELVEHSHY